MSGTSENNEWRRSYQKPLPVKKEYSGSGKYDIYPSFIIPGNKIFEGYESLAGEISRYKTVIVDGYVGVYFNDFKNRIDALLKSKSYSVEWTDVSSFLKRPDDILSLKRPFLGGDDPLFGTRCTLNLKDFFDTAALKNITLRQDSDINIIIGTGSYLTGLEGLLVYIDLPKNEIQYRARAGTICNFGDSRPADPGEMYKSFYFIDWVILNRHKQKILPSIGIFVDGQRPEMPTWITGNDLRKSLSLISSNPFRARPWFEPGPWGGTWIKDNIPRLSKDVDNYAWSFELISPENGLILESSKILLEISFDCLMYHAAEAVLGDCFSRFHYEFPIRFDFLDTFNGGNLSLQCHPGPEYIKTHFGEDFTQEETYYILDSKENSSVYLGFQQDIDPSDFKASLEKSRDQKIPFDAEKFVQSIPSGKHDLFLIPYGTIHGSGKNNLVLEISTTPYIFTFKMYDWLRNDLNGRPRTLNIERAMENLFFDRKGNYVYEKLVSRPILTDEGPGWQLYNLPTHETHLHNIMRYHFHGTIDIETRNKCLVMNLAEGTTIDIITKSGIRQSFSYAETFIVPAAAGSIKIINKSVSEAILVYAFVKN